MNRSTSLIDMWLATIDVVVGFDLSFDWVLVGFSGIDASVA